MIESTDEGLAGGKVGLAKFRETSAEFREFAVGTDLSGAAGTLSESLQRQLVLPAGGVSRTAGEGALTTAARLELATNAAVARTFLNAQAREFEQAATRLRQLAVNAHRDSIREELVALLRQDRKSTRLNSSHT